MARLTDHSKNNWIDCISDMRRDRSNGEMKPLAYYFKRRHVGAIPYYVIKYMVEAPIITRDEWKPFFKRKNEYFKQKQIERENRKQKDVQYKIDYNVLCDVSDEALWDEVKRRGIMEKLVVR